MIRDGKIWVANTDGGEQLYMLPNMANRHGLVAGATGTGKTVTLKVLAESFSDMGVPVFMADGKGDIAGMLSAGTDSEDMQRRIAKFGLAEAGFSYQGYPVNFWDIYGEKGIQLRTTVSEFGPMLLARVLEPHELQTDILGFKNATSARLDNLEAEVAKTTAAVKELGDRLAENMEMTKGKLIVPIYIAIGIGVANLVCLLMLLMR